MDDQTVFLIYSIVVIILSIAILIWSDSSEDDDYVCLLCIRSNNKHENCCFCRENRKKHY